jgi:hypothetical protein
MINLQKQNKKPNHQFQGVKFKTRDEMRNYFINALSKAKINFDLRVPITFLK